MICSKSVDSLWKVGIPANDGARIFVNCLSILPSSVQVISLLLQTVVLLEYTETYEQSINHISLKTDRPRCYAKSPTVLGHVLVNTRPHQLCWGDRKMGTTISCTKCSQVAGLIHTVGRNISNIALIQKS